jgi:hypothetical protein
MIYTLMYLGADNGGGGFAARQRWPRVQISKGIMGVLISTVRDVAVVRGGWPE